MRPRQGADGVLDPALYEARRALRELVGSWEYAFAMGARCHGDHPSHRATREAARRLRSRVHELERRAAQPAVTE